MKKIFLLALVALVSVSAKSQLIKNVGNKVKDKASQRANQKTDQAIDKGLDKTEESINNAGKTKSGKATTSTSGTGSNTASQSSSNQAIKNDTIPSATPAALKVYQNYDFVPGDTIVFEDHFTDDQNGEFPSHWNLGAGQAVMNTVAGQHALLLTEGNYAHVSPLIKSPVFFNDAFTIECDYYVNNGYGPKFYFYDNSKDAKTASNDWGSVALSQTEVSVKVPGAEVELSASFPADLINDTYVNKWHHLAIAYKKNQLKIYVDQFRVLVVPNLGIVPHAFDIEGIGDLNNPIVLTNFRVARGAGMNMLGKKFTDAKIVTHGINFDIDKATIKPESMGTLNMIMQVMKDNPDVKFEVDGHTDNSGTKEHNLTLSQQRSDAVKTQLVKMGVDAARLTTKGFGDTKPISDNNTLEGKANNRRVEFVKK